MAACGSSPPSRRSSSTGPRRPRWRALANGAASAAPEQGGFIGTDDVSLLERLGLRVKVVPAPGTNLKVTTPEDWARL